MPAGVTTDVKTYQLFINGEWVKQRFEEDIPRLRSRHRRGDRAGPGRERRRREPRRRRRPQRIRRRPLGNHHRAGARPRPVSPGGQDPPEPSACWRSLSRRNTGKPIVEAEYDIDDVATCFEYYGGLATKISRTT